MSLATPDGLMIMLAGFIPMDDAVVMGISERVENLCGVVYCRMDWQPSALELSLQGFAVNMFHDQRDRVFIAHSIVERHDIRMMEASLDLDLPFESPHIFEAAANTRWQHFHGLDSLGDRVLDFVDSSHSTRADEVDYLVVANNVTALDRQ